MGKNTENPNLTKPTMSSNFLRFFLKLFTGILALFFYCEYLIYYVILYQCEWPIIKQTSNIQNEEPLRVMVLADTHLLGSRFGHWFDKLRREWQMYRAFQTAIQLHKPEAVFILGDILDEGFHCNSEEFEYHTKRFYNLFKVPEGTQMFLVVGNHDIGFHERITPYSNQRFSKNFNSTAIRLVSLKGNHFVLVNSMALQGDGCFICKPAEMQLNKIKKTLECSMDPQKNCEGIARLRPYSKPILLQHFPLYRKSDQECSDFDAAPSPLKEHEIFRETWECLSEEASKQLLQQIKPRLALSGHTHHGCTRKLAYGDGLEITIPSFSWRNKNNPNYGLGVFTPEKYAFKKCQMPEENCVISLYIGGLSCLLIWTLYSLYSIKQQQKYKYR